jgi:hypothetical protein
MTPLRARKTQLGPGPEQARAQLDDLAAALAPEDSAAGEQLRAVAVELIRRGLDVTVVTYQDTSWELEAILPGAPCAGTVTLDRDATGEGCQLAWEHWTSIAGPDGAARAADIAAALLRSITPPSAPSLARAGTGGAAGAVPG